MESSDGIRTPSPIEVKAEDEHPGHVVPHKRKTSVGEGEDPSLALPAAQTHLQRAHLAKTVPHLFEGGNGVHLHQSHNSPPSSLSATTTSSSPHHAAKSNSRSPSSSTRPSPNPSEEESGERGGSLGLGSRGDTGSHHMVPRGFRGPLPRLHDAEDIAPLPLLTPVAGSDLFNTINYPYNRNGYQYTAAGPASEHLPTAVYRTLETAPRGIHWSWSDRSPFTHISPDGTIVGSDRGFRSARANVPVREGSWYVELHILESEDENRAMKDGPHVRLGWSRREAGVNAPVGMNGYSYGVRDTTGEKVFLSRTYQYGTGFGPGDVVGMYISLPKAKTVNERDPMDPTRIVRKRIPIRYKGRLYFETLEYPVSKEMEQLMARSRRGEKLRDSRTEEESASVNAATGLLVQPQVEETAATKKKRKGVPGSGPGPMSDTQSQSTTLRALPTLGQESQVGFFVNGQAQGVAFENLLDFRPLRRQGSSAAVAGMKTNAANSSSLGLSESGNMDESSVITTSSSLASILKSRENFFDDGSLGYFPFVSLFGGAKVQIVSRSQDFRYPPPVNINEVLREADRKRGRGTGEESSERVGGEEEGQKWRPLEERYDEYMSELWKYDLADEERAKVTAHLLQASSTDNEDEDDETTQTPAVEHKPTAKATTRKSKKRATPSSHSNSPRTASTPLRDEQQQSTAVEGGGARSGIRVEIKPKNEDDGLGVADEKTAATEAKSEVDTPMKVEWSHSREGSVLGEGQETGAPLKSEAGPVPSEGTTQAEEPMQVDDQKE